MIAIFPQASLLVPTISETFCKCLKWHVDLGNLTVYGQHRLVPRTMKHGCHWPAHDKESRLAESITARGSWRRPGQPLFSNSYWGKLWKSSLKSGAISEKRCWRRAHGTAGDPAVHQLVIHVVQDTRECQDSDCRVQRQSWPKHDQSSQRWLIDTKLSGSCFSYNCTITAAKVYLSYCMWLASVVSLSSVSNSITLKVLWLR